MTLKTVSLNNSCPDLPAATQTARSGLCPLNSIFFCRRGWTYPDEGCSRSADDRDRPAILKDDRPPPVGGKPRPTNRASIRRRANARCPSDVWPRAVNPGDYRDWNLSASSAENRARNTGSPAATSSRRLRVNIRVTGRVRSDGRWKIGGGCARVNREYKPAASRSTADDVVVCGGSLARIREADSDTRGLDSREIRKINNFAKLQCTENIFFSISYWFFSAWKHFSKDINFLNTCHTEIALYSIALRCLRRVIKWWLLCAAANHT